MSSSLFTQDFRNQFSTQAATTQGDALTFNDISAPSQDHFLQFTDFSQGASQLGHGWPDPLAPQIPRQYGAGVDGLANGLGQLRFDEEGFDEEASSSQPEPPPEWTCAYCGVSDAASVAKCLSTGRWFCNGRMGTGGSCIIVHLVRARLREVQLHRDSPLGDAVLECYASGSRNVFNLGFVPVSSDCTVVLLARDTPPSCQAVRDLQLDLSQWQPIIEDRCFVPWLVKPPPDDARLRARRLTPSQVAALEEAWKADPGARLEDVEAAGRDGGASGGGGAAEERLVPVALRYEDAAQYAGVMGPLIQAEAAYDRVMREQQRRAGISVRWDVGLNKKRLAYFFFPQDDISIRLFVGDELKLVHPAAGARGAWEGTGHLISGAHAGGSATEEICVEMVKGEVPDDVASGYAVEFVWKSTSYDRQAGALKAFRDYSASISGYLFHLLLGHQVEPMALRLPLPKSGFSAPNLPELNHSQLAAVRTALTQPLSLIQGPPGTGKTVTSATIVYHLCHSANAQLLVCAPSNVAVDQLAEKIASTGLRVVRLCARSREALGSPVEHLALHYQVAHLQTPTADTLRKLRQLKAEKGGLSAADERQAHCLRRGLEQEILGAADVVCCTCVGAGDGRLCALRFQHVLVDESTQASEPEALLPLVLGAKQVILVGDHCQLGPVIMAKKAAEAGLSQSLFERLRLLGIKPLRLQVQYRMHPCLSEFPSNTFYEGTLQNGAGTGDRAAAATSGFPWPDPRRPMMFWVSSGAEEISASGTSYLNRAEAAAVEKLLTRFLQCGVTPDQLGVITPYEGQRAHVVQVLTTRGPLRQDLYRAIEVSSVDAFQGREKDYIIVSCVRSNEASGIGFLSDPRRLNVALTRARFGLILLGNPRVLSRQPLWSALLAHFRERELLVEGPLTNLKPSMLQLAAPKRRFDRAAFGVNAVDANTALAGTAAVAGAAALAGRYVPTERVGDAPPAAAAQPHGRADGALNGDARRGGGRGTGSAAAAAAAAPAAAAGRPNLSASAGPSYAIPPLPLSAVGGPLGVRPGAAARPPAGFGTSQVGLQTQPDFGAGGASQLTLGGSEFGGSDLLTQAGRGASLGGGAGFTQPAGTGFSQGSTFGFGAGFEDLGGLGLGAGNQLGIGAGGGAGMLSQGFSQGGPGFNQGAGPQLSSLADLTYGGGT